MWLSSSTLLTQFLFSSMLSFTDQIISGFNVSKNAVRVAVAQYTDTGDIAISLGQYTDIISLRTAVYNISYAVTKQSFLTIAFGNMRTVFTNASRDGAAASLLVYVTNRAPADTNNQLSSSIAALQSAGIRLVSVGVFRSGTLDNSTRLMLSYYYDMILVEDCSQLTSAVNQTIFNACPLRGYLENFLTFDNN
jgi:hypothetical protein